MSDDVVFIRDAVTTQHVSCHSSNVQSLATGVSLDQGDHLWGGPGQEVVQDQSQTTLAMVKLKSELCKTCPLPYLFPDSSLLTDMALNMNAVDTDIFCSVLFFFKQ